MLYFGLAFLAKAYGSVKWFKSWVEAVMDHLTRPISSPLLTEKQAAGYLTRSVSTLRRGRKNGTGPRFVRIGRSVRYQQSELDAYIDSHIAGEKGEVGRG